MPSLQLCGSAAPVSMSCSNASVQCIPRLIRQIVNKLSALVRYSSVDRTFVVSQLIHLQTMSSAFWRNTIAACCTVTQSRARRSCTTCRRGASSSGVATWTSSTGRRRRRYRRLTQRRHAPGTASTCCTSCKTSPSSSSKAL